ncbi:hypothetical protein C8D03_3276 [Bosea sp. 124]|nr:hypothetical protein C8D03_3276 [Bosea sp. 124]
MRRNDVLIDAAYWRQPNPQDIARTKTPYHTRIFKLFVIGTLARFAGATYIPNRHTFS